MGPVILVDDYLPKVREHRTIKRTIRCAGHGIANDSEPIRRSLLHHIRLTIFFISAGLTQQSLSPARAQLPCIPDLLAVSADGAMGSTPRGTEEF